MYLCSHWSKESTVKALVETLNVTEQSEYTTVVSASASQPAPMFYIAPYAGTAMGEEWMYQGTRCINRVR